MKKIREKLVTRWDFITLNLALIIILLFVSYLVLGITGSSLVIEPGLGLFNAGVLLLGLIYYLVTRFLPVQKCWKMVLIVAVISHFLLIFTGFVLLLFSAA